MDSPHDVLRIAQALLRACKAELVEARLSERYGVTLLVHGTTLSLRGSILACDSTLGNRRAARVVMAGAIVQSLLADGVGLESGGAVAQAELAEVFGPGLIGLRVPQ